MVFVKKVVFKKWPLNKDFTLGYIYVTILIISVSTVSNCPNHSGTFPVTSCSEGPPNSRDVPIIGSVIRLVADMAIFTILVIGTNALRTDIATDSLHGKYEYLKSLFARYKQIESLSILFHLNAKLQEAM